MIHRHPFGGTGHQSSRVIFGAAALSRVNQDEADRTLEVLLEHGVNHIDTAARYGDSEVRIGKWMARHRQDFFLATKTRERTRQGAWDDLGRSLDRLRVTGWTCGSSTTWSIRTSGTSPWERPARSPRPWRPGNRGWSALSASPATACDSVHAPAQPGALRLRFRSAPLQLHHDAHAAVCRRRGNAARRVRPEERGRTDDQVPGRRAVGRAADAQHLVRAAGGPGGHRGRRPLGTWPARRVSQYHR